jgi:hypothetical protein
MEVSPLPDVNLKAIRSLRVLRPLRTINSLPGMRKLVHSFLDSIPSMLNALLFMFFIFLQFAIFGSEQFGGAYFSRCRTSPKPKDGIWPINLEVQRICAVSGSDFSC